MHRFSSVAIVLLLGATYCFAQTSTAPAGSPQETGAAHVIGHGSIPVIVTKTLDSSKLHAGDQLQLETAGEFILPGGTHVAKKAKVTAHVVKSDARSSGAAESALTIQFDSIDVGGGNTQPVKGFIQAVGPNLDTSGPVNPMMETSSKQAGAGSGMAPTDVKSGSNTSQSGGAEMLNAQSTGVHGVHNLDLSADGVLTSKGKNVKVESGDQLIVKVELLQP